MNTLQNIILATLLTITSACSANNAQAKFLTGSTINSYQKPGAPIDLTYSSTIVNNPGDLIGVELKFRANLSENTKFSISMTHDDSLELHSFNGPVNLDASKTIDVNVYSREKGLAYINVFVKYYKNDKYVSKRVFSVPVQTGVKNVIAKKSSKANADNSENLIIHPAQTTIIRH
jgi:hypothetical protein